MFVPVQVEGIESIWACDCWGIVGSGSASEGLRNKG